MKTVVTKLLICVALISCLVFFVSNEIKRSYERGKSDATAEFKQQEINGLSAIIAETQTLVDHANSVSQKIELAIAGIQTADQKTTQEIYRALSRTAAARVNCTFDADIMQQLAAARDRANQAAAGGFTYPVSTRTRTD